MLFEYFLIIAIRDHNTNRKFCTRINWKIAGITLSCGNGLVMSSVSGLLPCHHALTNNSNAIADYISQKVKIVPELRTKKGREVYYSPLLRHHSSKKIRMNQRRNPTNFPQAKGNLHQNPCIYCLSRESYILQGNKCTLLSLLIFPSSPICHVFVCWLFELLVVFVVEHLSISPKLYISFWAIVTLYNDYGYYKTSS